MNHIGETNTSRDVESKVVKFGSLDLTNINYMFDKDFGYAGFTALIKRREPMSTKFDIPLISNIFTAATRDLGPATAMVKSPDLIGAKEQNVRMTYEGHWIGKNGIRVDIHCEDYGNKTCGMGYVEVRNLNAVGPRKVLDEKNFFTEN